MFYHSLSNSPPAKSLPHLFQESRGLNQQGSLSTPFGEGTSPTSSWRLHRFVRLHTALPSFLLLLAPLSSFPPQGHPSPTRLPPVCLPICLHPKMSPGPPPASLCSTYRTQREASTLSTASHLPWGNVQGNSSYSWPPCPSPGQHSPPTPQGLEYTLPSKALKASPRDK